MLKEHGRGGQGGCPEQGVQFVFFCAHHAPNFGRSAALGITFMITLLTRARYTSVLKSSGFKHFTNDVPFSNRISTPHLNTSD